MNDAGRQAESLLARVWNPAGGVLPVPVDAVFIAEQLGMDVFAADLGEGTAGMLVKKAGQDPAIYRNSSDSPNRQRFTCAHEVGHYIQRVDRGATGRGSSSTGATTSRRAAPIRTRSTRISSPPNC